MIGKYNIRRANIMAQNLKLFSLISIIIVLLAVLGRGLQRGGRHFYVNSGS